MRDFYFIINGTLTAVFARTPGRAARLVARTKYHTNRLVPLVQDGEGDDEAARCIAAMRSRIRRNHITMARPADCFLSFPEVVEDEDVKDCINTILARKGEDALVGSALGMKRAIIEARAAAKGA